VRTSAIPTAEALYSDNNTNVGMTTGAMKSIDSGLAKAIDKIGGLSATGYCIQATVGGFHYKVARPVAQPPRRARGVRWAGGSITPGSPSRVIARQAKRVACKMIDRNYVTRSESPNFLAVSAAYDHCPGCQNGPSVYLEDLSTGAGSLAPHDLIYELSAFGNPVLTCSGEQAARVQPR